MKTKYISIFLFFSFIIIGYVAIYIKRGSVTLNEIYTDSHGDEWRVPTNGTITKITEFLINEIPRLNSKFKVIGNDFDLDNSDYNTSSVLFIVLLGLVGLLFLLIVVIFFICRYACGCCGGKKLPRYGYTQTAINSVRISLLVFSFIFEGILMYGYFVNADLHKSINKLLGYFEEIGTEIDEDMGIIIKNISDIKEDQTSYNYLFDLHRKQFIADLEFSTRYAVSQTTVMKKFFNKIESIRMMLILFNLILSTIACAVGIAAGSVMRGWVMIVMVSMNTVSSVFFFFSTGCHFAGSKILYEYCNEINFYLSDAHFSEQIPMRLQYFIPCVNSPVFNYINDYFAQNTIEKINKLQDTINENCCNKILADENPDGDTGEDPGGDTGEDPGGNPGTRKKLDDQSILQFCQSPPFWFNITDEYYQDELSGDSKCLGENKQCGAELQNLLKEAVVWANSLIALDNQRQCLYSKNRMKQEDFLMCAYTKDNLDMLMMSQAVGCILVVIITCIGLPAIKKFEWAGYANMGGINQKSNNKFIGRKAKPKRQAKK